MRRKLERPIAAAANQRGKKSLARRGENNVRPAFVRRYKYRDSADPLRAVFARTMNGEISGSTGSSLAPGQHANAERDASSRFLVKKLIASRAGSGKSVGLRSAETSDKFFSPSRSFLSSSAVKRRSTRDLKGSPSADRTSARRIQFCQNRICVSPRRFARVRSSRVSGSRSKRNFIRIGSR